MAALNPGTIQRILEPFYAADAPLVEKLSTYLDLLLKWNARTNLTAVRTPEEIVRRHFGESLFVAAHLPPGETLLDFGSGAGFPGLPVQLARPGLRVTLAESQNKKAAFLREAARVLGVTVEVWAGRVEQMPKGRTFQIVALRAVDDPEAALREARRRLAGGGTLMHLAGSPGGVRSIPVPGMAQSFLSLWDLEGLSVPRGTVG